MRRQGRGREGSNGVNSLKKWALFDVLVAVSELVGLLCRYHLRVRRLPTPRRVAMFMEEPAC